VTEGAGESGRRHARRRTLLRGLAVSRDGSFVTDAVIRDLSETGAKLVLASTQGVPERFYLIISGRECAYEAAVVRVRNDEVGVNLGTMHPLASLHGAQWQFLRGLIVERLPRSGVRE
jgi:hypothetical protein